MSIAGQVLTISAGNSVTLTDTNTDSQTLSIAGQVLTISAGNSITLADTNTDTQTLSFISDVLTISGGNSVTIRSLPFTVSDGNTLAWNGTTNQWNAVNDLRVPVAVAADPIQIFKSLVPANSTAELGRTADVFEKVFTKEIRSETASLVFNTGVSSLTAPQIIFEQGSTQIGGFGQNRFFVGNFTGGDYYIFPGTTTGANLNDVLTFNGSNALNFNSISTLEQQDLDDVVVIGGTTTRSIAVGDFSADGDINVFGGNINIATSLSNDTVELGNSNADTLVILATLSSTIEVVNDAVDLGSSSQALGTIYTQNIDSNTSGLEFKRAGNTQAGIDTSNNFFIGQDSATGYTFPTTEPLSVDRQVLAYTASNTLSFLSIAITDSQTIAAALSGTTLELRPENITTASITVDLSVLANTDTQTLAQVTAQGSQTTDNIQVGGLRSTSYLVVQGSSSLDGDITLGDASSDQITFQGRVANSIEFTSTGNSIASSTTPLTDIFTDALKPGIGNDLTIDSNSTSQEIEFANNGNTKAGVNSTTFFIGDNANYYKFPLGTATRIAGQALTVSSTTNELYFATIPSLPTATNEGAVLRWNGSSWVETTDLRIAPGTGFSPGTALWVDQSLIPSSTSLDLGQTGNEFGTVYAGELRTDSNHLTFTTNSQNIYLKKDADNLVVQDNTTAMAASNERNVAFGLTTLNPSSSSAIDNVAFGYRTLNSLTNGDYNTAIGNYALSGLQGGRGNIALGYSAGLSLTSGDYNISVGYQALRSLSTGSDNVGVGTAALRNLTTSSYNTALGGNAGYELTGRSNTALGHSALQGISGSAGQYNTGVGEKALYGLDSGNNNVAVGVSALQSNTTANSNTAIGHNAMYDTTTGSKNVAVGSSALENNTSGADNIALGYQALQSNTTGSGNIAIGEGADVRTNNMSNAIAIGKDAEVRFNNSIQLGNSLVTTVTTAGVISATGYSDTSLGDKNEILVVGDNARIVSTDILTIDGTNDRIGIGTSVPSVTLHMIGESSNASQIRLDQSDTSSDAPDIRFFKSRGTMSSPTAVANNDNIAAINSYAYNGTSFVQAGDLRWIADGTDGDSNFEIKTRVGGSNATRIEIDSFGDVDISGDLDVNDDFTVGGSIDATTILMNTTTAGAIASFQLNGTGVGSISVLSGSTTYNTTSDYRLKEDFKDFSGLGLVNAMQVYDYRWKEEGSRSFGVIAHELQNVIPYSVTGEKDGDEMQMVDYSKLVPVLTKAIQEQQEQLEVQQQQLESQADQIRALKQMVEQLIQAQQ